MSRGRNWVLLGGVDPTPGRTEVIEHIVESLSGREVLATESVGELTTFGHAVGGSTWQGRAAETFLTAFGPVPSLVAAQANTYGDAGSVLIGWASLVADLQEQADRLLERASENDEAHRAAESALPAAQEQLGAARRALDHAEDDSDREACFRRIDRAHMRVSLLEREVERTTEEAARLIEQAMQLREEHGQAAVGVAGRISDTVAEPVPELPFAVAMHAVALDRALPDINGAGSDGVYSPAELAALIEHAMSAEVTEGLSLDAHEALERMLAEVADHPEAAGEVLSALEPDGVEGLLLNLDSMGRYTDAESFRPIAEGIFALIATASATAAGRQVLLDVAHGHSMFTAVLLATVDGLDAAVIVAIAERAIGNDQLGLGGEWPMGFPFAPNELYPDFLTEGALGVVLLALASSVEATNDYLAVDTAERVRALLHPYNYDRPVSDATLQVLLVALAAGNPDAQTVAQLLIEDIGTDGLSLDLNLEILALLVPHLNPLVDDGLLAGQPITRREWQAFLTQLLDGLDGAEVQTLVDIVVGVAVQDAAGISLPGEAAIPLTNVLKNELSEVLGPLQDALEANELSVEQAQAAITAGVKQGVGIIKAITTTLALSPTTALGKLAVSQISTLVADIVADQVAAAISPESLEAPGIHDQATAVINQLLPHIAQDADIRRHLIEEYNADVVLTSSISVDTPPEYTVRLTPMTSLVITENTYETLVNDLADGLGAGWSP